MNEKEMIKAVLVKPGEAPSVIAFEHTLNEMQRLVGGGLIQLVYPYEDDAVLVCNDEGKLLEMPLNRALYDERGRMYDIIAGDFFVCRAPADNDELTSLTENQIKKYMKQYQYPEVFYRTWNGIEAVQVKPHSRDYER